MKTLISRLDHGTRLSTAVVVVIAVTLIPLVIALWPHQPGSTATTYPSAVLSDVSYTDCENVTDEVPCGQATGTLNTGQQVEVMLFRDAWLSHAANGDRSILYASSSPDSDTVYTFHSHDRAIKLAVFTIIVIIVVCGRMVL